MSVLWMDGLDHYIGTRQDTYSTTTVSGLDGVDSTADSLRRMGYRAGASAATSSLASTRMMAVGGRNLGDDSKGLAIMHARQVMSPNTLLPHEGYFYSEAGASAVNMTGRNLQVPIPPFQDAVTVGFAVYPRHLSNANNVAGTDGSPGVFLPLVSLLGETSMNQQACSLWISPPPNINATVGASNQNVPFYFTVGGGSFYQPSYIKANQATASADTSQMPILVWPTPIQAVGTDRYISAGDATPNVHYVAGTTITSNLILNSWNYIEVQLDYVSNRARLWINNTLWAELSLRDDTYPVRVVSSAAVVPGVSAPNNQKPTYAVFGPGVGLRQAATNWAVNYMFSLDDIYISDASGTSPVNARLGNIQVVTSFPTADELKGFTPVTGTSNFAMVNKLSPVNPDSAYVYASDSGTSDLYSSSKVMPNYDVYSVGVVVLGRRTGGDSRRLATLLRSNTTDRQGAPFTFNGMNYTAGLTIYDKDPATNANWTNASAKAVKFGMILLD